MTIKLANGTELYPIIAVGGRRYIQGENRDTLSFVFPEGTSLDELSALFTAENCESITIINEEAEYVHNAYTIRAELKCSPEVVQEATDTEAEVTENRVTVSMAQRTYLETQMNAVQTSLDALLMGEG